VTCATFALGRPGASRAHRARQRRLSGRGLRPAPAVQPIRTRTVRQLAPRAADLGVCLPTTSSTGRRPAAPRAGRQGSDPADAGKSATTRATSAPGTCWRGRGSTSATARRPSTRRGRRCGSTRAGWSRSIWSAPPTRRPGGTTRPSRPRTTGCAEDPGNPRLAERLGRALLAAGRAGEARQPAGVGGVRLLRRRSAGRATVSRSSRRPADQRPGSLRPGAATPAGARTAQQEIRRLTAAELTIVDAASLVRVCDAYAESLRVPPGGHPASTTGRSESTWAASC